MVIALIAVGVALFLAIDAFILYRVFSGQRSADAYGSVPVPGSLDVTLPAGKVKLNYHESKRSGGGDDDIYFDMPSAVTVTVTPAGGGDPLEIKGPGFGGMGSSKSTGKGYSRDLVGTIEISQPGPYTVSAEGDAGLDAVEPQILVGK